MRQLTDSRGRTVCWTYSLINTYEKVCPHQTFRKYVKRDLPFKETEPRRFGNEVHAAFDKRVGAGVPLPNTMAVWEPFALPYDGLKPLTEAQLAVDEQGNPTDYWGDKAFLRTKVDCVVMADSLALITDWKTGSSKYENSYELEINAVCLKARFPHLQKISGMYVYLKEGRMSETYDLSDTGFIWAVINDSVDAIMASHNEGRWAKRQGPLCGFCDVMDCENNRKTAA